MLPRSRNILAVCLLLLGACHSEVTKPQLYAQARRLRAETPQGQMIHEGSDSKYDYYRFEPGGQRFKVARPLSIPTSAPAA
jgi:hypothetical protein